MNNEAPLLLGEMLRQVMRHWATGVAVVTSAVGEARHGMTVNSFGSISLDPPLVTVTMHHDTRTYHLVSESGVFAVTILTAAQQELAERFAGRLASDSDRMASLETFTLVTGAPLLAGGAAFLDCKVVHQYEMRRSTLLIGEVVGARIAEETSLHPLVYINRHFTGLKDE
jgi:flavin reductase (DIM6/NTAB) family NADH-FMN oxidoreductase RutF